MTVLSAEVEEYAGAYMVLTYNDLYEMLAEIHDLVEECRKYAHGTAYITMDGDKNDPWHTIDLNDFITYQQPGFVSRKTRIWH